MSNKMNGETEMIIVFVNEANVSSVVDINGNQIEHQRIVDFDCLENDQCPVCYTGLEEHNGSFLYCETCDVTWEPGGDEDVAMEIIRNNLS